MKLNPASFYNRLATGWAGDHDASLYSFGIALEYLRRLFRGS
jgi:hypothetical protein